MIRPEIALCGVSFSTSEFVVGPTLTSPLLSPQFLLVEVARLLGTDADHALDGIPSTWKWPSPSAKTVRCELPFMWTSAWPTDSPVMEFTTEPVSEKVASLLLDRDGDICATAVPLKTAQKLKSSRSRAGSTESSGGDEKFGLAK